MKQWFQRSGLIAQDRHAWEKFLEKFPWAAATECHKLGSLKQQEFILAVMEARSLKLSCQQGHTPSETCKEESFLPSLSSFCLLLAVDSWLVFLVYRRMNPISASNTAWLSSPCVFLSIFLSLTKACIKTSYWKC